MAKKILVGVLVLFAIGIAGYLIWAANPPRIGDAAIAAMVPDNEVAVVVDKKGGVTFQPSGEVKAGLVFYPGARVRPASYAVEMRQLAEAGYLVVIPHMPFNLAVFDKDKADEDIKSYPDVQAWAIGGHSLGGAMAGAYADTHRDQIDGVLFWAAYPPKSNDLSDFAGSVTLVSASLDGLATPAKIEAAKPNLPLQTQYVEIEGGDHAQFGDYGPQAGDNPAKISPEDQWSQIVDASLLFLDEIAKR